MEFPHNSETGFQKIVQPSSMNTVTPEIPTNSLTPIPSHPIQLAADVHPSNLSPGEYQKAMASLNPRPATYWATLIVTGCIVPLPIAAAVITATLYITSPDWAATFAPAIPTKILVIFIGILGTLLLWWLVSWSFKCFTSFASANVHSASHLRRHILSLKSSLKILHEQGDSSEDKPEYTLRAFRAANSQDYDLALDIMCSCLVEANQQVAGNNFPWIMGSGYIGVWNFVHRAEEAVLAVAPREYVIREALHDEASIDGSTIADRDYILSNIKTAVKLLSPSAALYLKSLSIQDQGVALTDNGATGHALTPIITPSLQVQDQNSNLDPTIELEARNALRDARQTLNEFRSGLWEGLITLRNQLLGTSLITALLTYVLLFVSIGANIQAESMKAALVFYLVGAIVGLFSRLSTESQTSSAIDDYGLTLARVVVTPLVSGLAAIAGVLVMAILSMNILNAPGSSINAGLPQLGTIFDIVQNRQGIIVAALFGLTPNRLINILQQKADDTKIKLKNSSAQSQGNS